MNTATATTVHLVKIEDHEGFGICQECNREGLRWIARLSDGSGVGVECAKGILGYRPAPKSYAWVSDYTAIAEVVEYGETFVLWQHKRGALTSSTRNGQLFSVGGARAEWIARGWM
jgi:hypothetical protein